jgi:integrase
MRKPPYLNIFKDRHGKTRFYFLRNGMNIPLPPELGSSEFNDAYADALKQSEEKSKPKAPVKGSITDVITTYYGSSDYKTLSSSTRNTYRIELDKIRGVHGKKLITELQRKHIRALIDKLVDNPNQANKLLRFLGMICRFAISRDFIDIDPTTGIKKLKTFSGGFKDWPEELIERYQQHWPLGSKQRLAFDLALHTGQRRADLVLMHRNHVSNTSIQVKQKKTGVELTIPLHPDLLASLKATPTNGLFLLQTHYDQPFSAKGFGGRFTDWARAAGISKGYSVHGLRKSCCRRLAEAGCSASEIMSISGHVTLKEAERYTKAASQILLAQKAIARTE